MEAGGVARTGSVHPVDPASRFRIASPAWIRQPPRWTARPAGTFRCTRSCSSAERAAVPDEHRPLANNTGGCRTRGTVRDRPCAPDRLASTRQRRRGSPSSPGASLVAAGASAEPAAAVAVVATAGGSADGTEEREVLPDRPSAKRSYAHTNQGCWPRVNCATRERKVSSKPASATLMSKPGLFSSIAATNCSARSSAMQRIRA